MSFVGNIKISHKKNANILEPKKSKNKLLFNTMADLDKFNYYKSKKISKSKSSSVIIQKKKSSEKKRHIFIPINLKGPSIKTNNAKKKISYNKSTSDLINDRYQNLNNMKLNSNELIYKTKKHSQHNTINYIINNLSSKKKDSNHVKKFNEIKGISNPIVPQNNNKKIVSNNNINNNNLLYEELKKENEKLIFLFNEKLKDNKKNKNKIFYLEKKNEQILKKVNKIKKENDKYAKILEKVLKLLQILKSNGLDVEEILENLSYTEEDDFENNSNSDDISSLNSSKSFKKYELNSENPNLKSEGESILSENMKSHKMYKESKVTLKDNNIPKLDMKKIYNNNNTLNIKKFETNNTHKHKNYSHSVGK
jgi:hypothetical protein